MSDETVVVENDDLVVIDTESDVHVTLETEDLVVVSEAEQGPEGGKGDKGDKGEKGDPGLSGANFIHDQLVPSDEWVINHGLNRYPSVAVVDSAGSVVEGTVEYTSNNVITLRFAAPFGGQAFLN